VKTVVTGSFVGPAHSLNCTIFSPLLFLLLVRKTSALFLGTDTSHNTQLLTCLPAFAPLLLLATLPCPALTPYTSASPLPLPGCQS
jgi:hypothetical protein